MSRENVLIWFFPRFRFLLLIPFLFANIHSIASSVEKYDVVVYGGTSAGIAAAVQVVRMGKTVAVVEPSRHIGGLTSGGLGATDIGNKEAIGGISREFYQRVKAHYSNSTSWTWQKPQEYKSPRTTDQSKEDAMWTFEPHVAEMIMLDFVRENQIPVFLNERLDLQHGVNRNGTNIREIRTESKRVFHAKVFIDATYEGDLLATAGVSFFVGREANNKYQETLNGVQTANATKHQLLDGIDPYIVKGDPTSGLLPGIDPDGPGKEGDADRRLQAYCLRMCNTAHPDNRLPFEKPNDYNELDYELLFRNFEKGKIALWHPIEMPNQKTDTNNNGGFSTDFIGQNYDWPEADYRSRRTMFLQHVRYQKGLMWTLANHPRVPDDVRAEFSRWGNCKDEFTDNEGWTHQLYIREGRRLISDYVMNQHHCQGKDIAEDPIGLAAYTMDSHNVQRYVDDQGHVRNEGDVQVGGFSPFPISYRSIVPKREECSNLLVPVALAASHIAYGSIRMEPVFMVLGQSAATAACHSAEDEVTVQDVDFEKLRDKLIADKQVLEWKP